MEDIPLGSNSKRPDGEADRMIDDEVERLDSQGDSLVDKLTRTALDLENIMNTLKAKDDSPEAEVFREQVKSPEFRRDLNEQLDKLVKTQTNIVEKVEQINARIETLKSILEVNPEQN